MSKLSLDALKERAEVTASTELLATISGGTANSCHTSSDIPPYTSYIPAHMAGPVNLVNAIIDWFK